MTNVIDFTRYHDSIRWTLVNGWNIYIWNRMLQKQEQAIRQEGEEKFLSPETAFPGIPKRQLDSADIGMEIDGIDDKFPGRLFRDHKDPELDTTDTAREVADKLNKSLHKKHPPEQVQFISTPLGHNYFYDYYIQSLNQREEPAFFNWPTPKEEKQDFPDYGANITMADIPSLVEDGRGNGLGNDSGPQHNSKELSQQKNSCRIQDTTGEEN